MALGQMQSNDPLSWHRSGIGGGKRGGHAEGNGVVVVMLGEGQFLFHFTGGSVDHPFANDARFCT